MAPRDTGVIHDIGYRNYDGARLGRSYLVRSLFVQSLRGAYGLGRPARSKVMPALLLAAITFPALIIVVVTMVTGSQELPLAYTDYVPYTFYIVAVFLAAQAPQLISHDLRFRTVPLYFSRPINAADYVIAKYGALAAALFALMAMPLLVMYVGAMLTELPFWAQTRGVAKGLTGAVLFAVLLAGLGAVIASATPRRGFGVAAIIAVIMVSYTVVSAVQGISVETDHVKVATLADLFSPFNLANAVQLWIFDIEVNPLFDEVPTADGGQGLLFVAMYLACVAGSVAFLLMRYRKASAR
ncbi:MAG TPA: hypothetical protein VGD67_07930 [Pseudonocardiaceae bacterium]